MGWGGGGGGGIQIVRITILRANRIRNKGSLEMGTRLHWKHVYEGNKASTTNILANWEDF